MKDKSLLESTKENKTTTADPLAVMIKGIGPATEHCLYEQGIYTVTKLAALSESELATLVADIPGITAERIEREDWLGQARQLAQTTSPREDEQQTQVAKNRQHYASFTLQLLLNEDNSVRRTQIVNNKDKAEIRWEGWDEEKMVAIIAGQAGVRLPSANTELSVNPEDQQVSAIEPPLTPKGVYLRQLDVLLADTDSPCHLVPHNQPFRLCLRLDLIDIDMPDDGRLDYTVTIHAKKLGAGERLLVTKQHNTVPLQSSLSIPVDGVLMPPGTFRLQAVVNLNLPQTARDFTASMEGDILQVY